MVPIYSLIINETYLGRNEIKSILCTFASTVGFGAHDMIQKMSEVHILWGL